MTLTKAQIITTMYNTTSLNNSQSAQLVNTLLKIITSTIASSHDVMIKGFGKFQISNNNHRRVRIAKTSNHVMPEAQRVMYVKEYYKMILVLIILVPVILITLRIYFKSTPNMVATISCSWIVFCISSRSNNWWVISQRNTVQKRWQ